MAEQENINEVIIKPTRLLLLFNKFFKGIVSVI